MKKALIFMLLFSSFSKIKAQVKYQTGSAEFGLPIFSWEDDKSRLNSSIAISYSSGNGLKVADVASNIGQGWHLQIGGSVSRIQSGEPDDQKPKDGFFDDVTKYPAGYLYDPFSAAEGCPSNMVNYPIFKDKNIVYKQHNDVAADKELDRFAFEINGRTGVFCLNKSNGNKGIVLGDTKLKVWYTRNENMPNIRTTINAFFIQDENGVIYKFTYLQVAKILKVWNTDASGTVAIMQPQFNAGNLYYENSFDDGTVVNPYVVNGWMLTEMEDALTHRKITFNYTTKNISAYTGANVTFYGEAGYAVVSHSQSVNQSPEITSIVYPDGHLVTLNYGEERVDLKGQNALKSIDVQYGSRFISKYELNTAYFIGNRIGKPESDYQKSLARLCLTSVKKIGVDLMSDDPPYKFEYYTGSSATMDIVPAPFSYRKDIWGFYNADETKSFHNVAIPDYSSISFLGADDIVGLCYIRPNSTAVVLNPKSGFAKNGLLKKIIYPTGGALKYEYAQNTALLNGQNTMVGGVHVSKSIASDEGNNYNCDVTNLTTNYNYTSSENIAQSSLWGIEPPLNKIESYSFYRPESKRYTWGVRSCSILGCCKYRFKYPGIMAREQVIDLTGHQKFMEAFSVVLDVVSLVSVIIDVVTLCLYSTGPGAIIAVIIDALFAIYVIISSCTKNYSKHTWTTTFYSNDLNNNPLPIQYSRVEVSESSGENGKTVMEFTSPQDYPIWEPTNPAFSNKQRFAYWAYGLPKKTTVFNATGNVVKESENVYDYQYARSYNTEIYDNNGMPQVVPLNTTSAKCFVKLNYSKRSDEWMWPDYDLTHYTKNMTSNPSLLADIYNMSTGRVELRNTIERVYSNNSTQFIESSTQYEYGKNFMPKKITTTQSNGDKNIKSFIYSADGWSYPGYTPYNISYRLIENNILNLPYCTKSMVTKASDNITYDVSETVTEYNKQPNFDIKPTLILTKRYESPTPVTSAVGGYYLGPGAYSYGYTLPFSVVKRFDYDEDVNLRAVWGELNTSNQNYLYDYNNKYITATVINAGAVYVADGLAYSSFETDKGNGWTLSSTANYAENEGVTGKRVLNLANNSIAANITDMGSGSNTTYGSADATKLSFWATNTVSVLMGAPSCTSTLISTGPTINGYTYYEYKLENTNTQQVTVNITGNAKIDEIRLYRSSARMRTTTYDPIVGKTSECDENNRITYYEYDEKGRMRFIKDEKSNVVKMYEYNNATKVNCPGQPLFMYSNLETSEIFVKTPCRGDLSIGSSVTYTIPAGTYTSTISQEVVDALVQQDLGANGQAYANTNGTCIGRFGNAPLSANFAKENCEVGYKGTSITYSVPINRYFSIASQAAANAQAQAEIDGNGQAFANAPGNATCVIDYDPEWEGTGLTMCGTGPLATHEMQQVIDINPNSSSYNTTQWVDAGVSAACGGIVVPYIDITYSNAGSTQATARFTNLATNEVILVNLNPNTNTQAIAGYVPAGNYDVTVTLGYGSNANSISVYNTTQLNSFHQTPVTVTTSSQPIIRIAF
jgi:hypothetical protein